VCSVRVMKYVFVTVFEARTAQARFVTGVRPGPPEVQVPARARVFSLLQNVQTRPGTIGLSEHWIQGNSLPGIGRLEHEFAEERPYNAKVKNALSYNSSYLNRRFCLPFETGCQKVLTNSRVRISSSWSNL